MSQPAFKQALEDGRLDTALRLARRLPEPYGALAEVREAALQSGHERVAREVADVQCITLTDDELARCRAARQEIAHRHETSAVVMD